MTQVDKELLIRYLSMALPYGLKVWYKYYSENITEKFATSIRLVDEKIALSSKFNREGDWYPIEEANELLIKPYVRPMSSMTEEEKKEYRKTQITKWIKSVDCTNGGYYEHRDTLKTFDWLNAHHFDFRNLIPMGLALEAPKGMYNS